MFIPLLHVCAEDFPKEFREYAERVSEDPDYAQSYLNIAKELGRERWEAGPKWRYTAKFMKYLYPACDKCAANRNLEVHHITYVHMGIEIAHLGDLQVLCHLHHREITYLQKQMTLQFQPIIETRLSRNLDSRSYRHHTR